MRALLPAVALSALAGCTVTNAPADFATNNQPMLALVNASDGKDGGPYKVHDNTSETAIRPRVYICIFASCQMEANDSKAAGALTANAKPEPEPETVAPVVDPCALPPESEDDTPPEAEPATLEGDDLPPEKTCEEVEQENRQQLLEMLKKPAADADEKVNCK
jgi:hypothetical protein